MGGEQGSLELSQAPLSLRTCLHDAATPGTGTISDPSATSKFSVRKGPRQVFFVLNKREGLNRPWSL